MKTFLERTQPYATGSLLQAAAFVLRLKVGSEVHLIQRSDVPTQDVLQKLLDLHNIFKWNGTQAFKGTITCELTVEEKATMAWRLPDAFGIVFLTEPAQA